MRARVVDAGPLLFLARLGRLDLLLLGADQIYVPVAVPSPADGGSKGSGRGGRVALAERIVCQTTLGELAEVPGSPSA